MIYTSQEKKTQQQKQGETKKGQVRYLLLAIVKNIQYCLLLAQYFKGIKCK